jgi:hypothetical protein
MRVPYATSGGADEFRGDVRSYCSSGRQIGGRHDGQARAAGDRAACR